MTSYVSVKFEKEKRKTNCEMSLIDRTKLDPTIYKEEAKVIICLCVEHREFKVT